MGEFYRKGGPFPQPGVYRQAAVMQTNDLVGEGQPNAMPVRIIFVRPPEKGGEDIGNVFFGNAYAAVGAAEDNIFFVEADGHRCLMIRREFTAVLDKVLERYFQ